LVFIFCSFRSFGGSDIMISANLAESHNIRLGFLSGRAV
jgi:hypothetical protein